MRLFYDPCDDKLDPACRDQGLGGTGTAFLDAGAILALLVIALAFAAISIDWRKLWRRWAPEAVLWAVLLSPVALAAVGLGLAVRACCQ